MQQDTLNDLLAKLETLEQASSALEPTENQRTAYLNQLNEYSSDFIQSLDSRNTFSKSKANAKKLAIDGKKKNLEQLLKIYSDEVVDHGLIPASGGHIGYIPGGGLYTAALGDFLAAVSNEYAGMYFGSPGAVTIENELINWLKNVFHFPVSAVGNLTSGGSIANLIALTAARDKHGIKNEKIENAVIYLSPQVHHCIHKALRIIGLEDIVIRELELDEFSRIDAELLKKHIEVDKKSGLHPFMIIASAGTTDTGAVDPLDQIADIAHSHQMWFHVDAAYGGFFILSNQVKDKFRGIEKADSLVVDPHKGLFLPYGLGAVLVKDKDALFHSHHYTANYMQDATNPDLPLNPADVSPELTKHFRGLRMWFPLQMHGIEPFIACLDEKLILTQYFRLKLAERGFRLGPEPDLSVSYFYWPSTKTDVDAFNQKLTELIHADGKIFLSSTKINGKQVIRMAILSFRTKRKTIDDCLAMIDRCLIKTKKYFNEI
ncbi:MAG: aminotransferase class V-fold PLP-dependent enzyme [Crocinitomicaceae bacterium]|nr:aminotransferase class V-fold PLP-dependent enzyme [Crocinitomicaceae bacterium]MBK8925638.1 aminotransferase class V-fold PLP-dependent enzyme [Crocinitomicaceae bacterium]